MEFKKIQPSPILPHIQRVEITDKQDGFYECLEELMVCNRILIVYGQNPRPTSAQLANIEAFTAKFDCVILTDLISNLYTTYSLQTFNLLQQISQKDFDNNLKPDILISVGGKRLMNDPLTGKIRRCGQPIKYWCVNPDGKLRDFYFKLTKIIECSQDYFFYWFATHAKNNSISHTYYKVWNEANSQHLAPKSEKFDSHYIQSQFLPAIPKGSLLHLGVGLSFYYTRRYIVDPTVEVYCNIGANGIDGCTSTFMGSCTINNHRLCFLLVGDLSFFYDMNSIWNKILTNNIRILLVNNNGSDLLRYIKLKNITCIHNTRAKEWAESVGFEYLSAKSKDEFNLKLNYFVSDAPKRAVFFETIYNF